MYKWIYRWCNLTCDETSSYHDSEYMVWCDSLQYMCWKHFLLKWISCESVALLWCDCIACIDDRPVAYSENTRQSEYPFTAPLRAAAPATVLRSLLSTRKQGNSSWRSEMPWQMGTLSLHTNRYVRFAWEALWLADLKFQLAATGLLNWRFEGGILSALQVKSRRCSL